MSTHKTRIRLLTAALLCAVALAPASQGVGLPALPPLPQLPPECRLDLVATFGDEQSAGIGPLCQTIREGDIGIGGGGGGIPEECRFDLTADLQPLDLPRMPQQTVGIGEFCQTVKDTDIPGPGDVPEECSVATAALQQPADLPGLPQQSADIGEVCQAVKDTEIPGTGPNKGPKCEKGENDHNLGGTHVHCEYSCPETSLLGITVTAEDHDATAYGDTDCGGARAWCDNGTWQCAGVSERLTQFGEYDQRCNGHSDEVVDSRVTVTCYAIGPDSALCAINPMFCDLGVNVAMQDFCVEANPLLGNAPSEDVVSLFSAVPDGVVSMVSYWYEAAGGLAVRFEVDHLGGVSCIAQAFTL